MVTVHAVHGAAVAACRPTLPRRRIRCRAPVTRSAAKPQGSVEVPEPPPKKPTPIDHLTQFLWKGYQPEFHVANLTLFLTEAGLMHVGQTIDPITSDKCLAHPTFLGCFYTSATKAFPDEIGFAMFAAGLAYTGFIAALAVKNYKRCKGFLLENGFTADELNGVTTYMVVRYAELMVKKGMLPEAKAYIAKIKYECGYFIHMDPEKEYVPPYANVFGKAKKLDDSVKSNIVPLAKKEAPKEARDASEPTGTIRKRR